MLCPQTAPATGGASDSLPEAEEGGASGSSHADQEARFQRGLPPYSDDTHTTLKVLDTTRIDIVSDVESLVAETIAHEMQSAGLPSAEGLLPGKMLRTRLAARVVSQGNLSPCRRSVVFACAATELVHTASLCHDDVIDSGVLRRGEPTLWKLVGSSAAVLAGDLLFCSAMDLVLQVDGGNSARDFVDKVREVCKGEAMQELQFRGTDADEETLLSIARMKTGPLFAFPLAVCGAAEPGELQAALEEAGYRIGTAYQLLDDLVDVIGDENTSGKTLGTDGERQKSTLAQGSEEQRARLKAHVERLCREAVEQLRDRPDVSRGVRLFLKEDLGRVIEKYHEPLAREIRDHT